MDLAKLHTFISQVRPDVVTMELDDNGNPVWDLTLPNQQQISDLVAEFNSTPQNLSDIVNAKIYEYQKNAPTLLRELYVTNTLSGITTAQSDQMFDEFADVLIRLKEGAYPTALYRLNQKTPSGFVTQELIDAWKSKITSYMI